VNARDDIHRLFESGRTSYHLDEYLDAHRAEVLREAEGKAREIVAKLWVDGTTQKQMNRADGARAVEWEIGLMASGNDEPAAAPDFFQPGRTYTSGTWEFRCVAVSPSPTGGELRALGWKFAPAYDVHYWHATALDPDDWKHGGWTEAGEVTFRG
jgi:hypothetical protein